MNPPTIVLASGSRWRADVLQRCGVPFEVDVPGIDEPFEGGITPEEQAARLALAKARHVAARRPDAIVIGADQIAVFEGRLLRKPVTPAETTAQLMRLQGRVHTLVSGVAVISAGRAAADAAVYTLEMAPLDEATAATYVAADGSVGCVGGFRIESRGRLLFRRIEGGDESGIVGLPIPLLSRLFADLGHNLLARALS